MESRRRWDMCRRFGKAGVKIISQVEAQIFLILGPQMTLEIMSLRFLVFLTEKLHTHRYQLQGRRIELQKNKKVIKIIKKIWNCNGFCNRSACIVRTCTED